MKTVLKTRPRIAHYDCLRGLAISWMIMANSAASLYEAIPPLAMRLPGSLAAPTFMLLAGMMLANSKKANPPRGLRLLIIACAIDILINQTLPLVTFDVLYCIGFGILMIARPAQKLSGMCLSLIGLGFFGLASLMQQHFTYQQDLFQISLAPITQKPLFSFSLLEQVVQQLFISGWFPLFPWLGFIWLGAGIQKLLSSTADYSTKAQYCSIGCLAISTSVWLQDFSAPPPRLGYSELFYPAGLSFCLFASSAFLTLLFGSQFLCQFTTGQRLLKPFVLLGQQSLFIYILHLLILRFGFVGVSPSADLKLFLYQCFAIWIVCILSTMLLSQFKYQSNKTPVIKL